MTGRDEAAFDDWGETVSYLLRTTAVAVVAAATSAACPAAAQAQNAIIAFEIAPGRLDQVLRSYAKTTGRQLLYRPEAVAAKRSSGVRGRFRADDALDRIVADSGLTIERPSSNVIVLRNAMSGIEASAILPQTAEESASNTDIVVTGSNIRGGNPTSSLRVLDRRSLDRSGKATVADLIAAQTASFGGAGNPVAALAGADQSSLNYSLAPAANLRGLGPDATLTLFDGRRAAGSGGRGDFTDLSAIPTLAVERVEILTDGASAIYGSDAIGGVVNIILRKRLNGLEARVRGSLATDGEPRSVIAGLVAGRTWKSGSVLLAYEYEHRDRLPSRERAYTATGDLTPFGGSDRRGYFSSPGNVLEFSQAAGTFVPAYAIPDGLGRQPTAADIRPGANPGFLYQDTDLSPRIDRHVAYGYFEESLTDGLSAFLQGRYAARDFAYASPAAPTILVVTPANPYYIPVGGQPIGIIGYSFLRELGVGRVAGKVRSFSATGGVTWQIGSGWTLDAYGSFARERSGDRSGNQLNSTALDEALGNTPDDPLTPYAATRDGYFNPYGSGSSNSPAILGFVGGGYAAARRRSSIADGTARAEGPIVALPAGEIRLAAGGSYRREAFLSSGETFLTGAQPTPVGTQRVDRGIKAAFAEVRVPVFGPSNQMPGLRALTISAAVRHEEYADFGKTTNPKLGIAMSPAAGVTLRASWGTSFRAPALTEVSNPRRVVGTTLATADGTFLPSLIIVGGNPALGPERARTLSFGAVVQPAAVEGLKWEVNLFTTRFRDRIAQPALEDFTRALSNPALAPFVRLVNPAKSAQDLAVIRALLSEPGSSPGTTPPEQFGAIVDGRFVNTSTLEVSGLDWDLGISRAIGRGRLDAGLSATWLFRYSQKLTRTAPTIDRLDTLGNPVDLRMRGIASWTQGAATTTIVASYVDPYRDDVSSPIRGIDAFVTFDGSISVAPARGPLKRYRITLAVDNIFGAEPPFVDRVNGLGFDAANASPFGRTVSLELRRSW